MLVSEKSDEYGLIRATQIKEHFSSHPSDLASEPIPMTVSIGIAVYPTHGKTTDELLTKAEAALAISKKSGGNQITFWAQEA